MYFLWFISGMSISKYPSCRFIQVLKGSKNKNVEGWQNFSSYFYVHFSKGKLFFLVSEWFPDMNQGEFFLLWMANPRKFGISISLKVKISWSKNSEELPICWLFDIRKGMAFFFFFFFFFFPTVGYAVNKNSCWFLEGIWKHGEYIYIYIYIYIYKSIFFNSCTTFHVTYLNWYISQILTVNEYCRFSVNKKKIDFIFPIQKQEHTLMI